MWRMHGLWSGMVAIAMSVIAMSTIASPADAASPGCKPDLATLPPVIRHVALKPDEARIRFVGHATFLIESATGVTAATDYNDFVRADVTPLVATMNKAHSTHFSRNPEPGIRHLLRGWDSATGGPLHDVTEGDMRIRNVPTNLRGWSGADTEYDANSIFIFEIGELCIVHLGHLHHTLEPGHIRAIGRADVLLVPVDGGFTLDMEGMFEVLTRLQARIMIPMHFFGSMTLERFLTRAAVDWPVERRSEPVITVSRASLPPTPTVIVLPGR